MIGTDAVQGMVLELQNEMSQYQHQFDVRRNAFLAEAMYLGLSEGEARSYAIQSIGPVVPVTCMPTLAPGKARYRSVRCWKHATVMPGTGRTWESICSCRMTCYGSQAQSGFAAGSATCGIIGWNRPHTDLGMIVFRCCRSPMRRKATFPCWSGRSPVRSQRCGPTLRSMNTDSVICSTGSSG